MSLISLRVGDKLSIVSGDVSESKNVVRSVTKKCSFKRSNFTHNNTGTTAPVLPKSQFF